MGNSSTKLAVFEGTELVSQFSALDLAEVASLIGHHHPEHLIIGSVGQQPQVLIDLLTGKSSVWVLDDTLNLPIVNQYRTPKSLGNDRLAAVVGAQFLYPGCHCLVVDLGTCVTYDIIDDQSKYQGGLISPGLSMRYAALHNLTARLPLVEHIDQPALLGVDTEGSIQGGVTFGLIAEIEGIIQRYENEYPGLKIVFCGGDAQLFESKIKQRIFVIPNLVLIGLNAILLHHVQEN